MKKLLGLAVCGTLGLILAGCEQSAPPAVKPTNTATNAATGGLVPAAPEGPAKTVLEKAGVGSGKKGRSLDAHEGIIVTPAKTLFAAKEKIKFEIEVPHALQLYKALEGSGPKSHDEFMEKVIKANQIQLPELPAGHEYLYDPTTETLMVKKPAP